MTDSSKQMKLWQEMFFLEKCKHIWNNITVEPLVACYIVPSVLANLATQNLNLEKACRVNLAYSREVCDALQRRETTNYTEQEANVQVLVAGMAGWKTILQSVLPCFLILFWGSWSDRNGRRKPCMIIPIFGELLTAIGLIMCTYFENVPMEVAGIIEGLFPGIAGGWFIQLMGTYSYISDITNEENRTLRIGLSSIFFSLGVPLGMAFSGILLKQIGFYGVFTISATLYTIGILYGLFIVKEPTVKTPEELAKIVKSNIIADFFDIKHISETFKVALKRRANQKRLRIIMIMIIVMVVIGPLHGEIAVLYLFTRYQFNWNEVEFSFFYTYALITGLFGTLFSVGVLSHMLKIDDALIGAFSCISKVLSSFVFAFSITTWQIYMAPIVEILSGTSLIAMRSILTKQVNRDELGKVNSLVGVAETLMPLVYAPMYTTVYAATLKTLPGAFFLLGGGLLIIAVVIFFWLYTCHKKDEQRISLEAKIPLEQNNNCQMTEKNQTDSNLSQIGFNNNSYVPDNSDDDNNHNKCISDCEIIKETIEVVRDFPNSYVEHSRL